MSVKSKAKSKATVIESSDVINDSVASAAIARRVEDMSVKAAWDSMTDACRKKTEELAESIASSDTGQILTAWNVGESVEEITASPNKYGQGAVELMAKAINRSPSTLYSCRRLHQSFSEKRLSGVMSQRSPISGEAISVAKLLAIVPLPTEEQQNEVITQCLAGNWSVRVLQSKVKERQGIEAPKPRGVSGRKANVPDTPSEGLRDMVKTMQSVLNRQTVWSESIFKPFEEDENLEIDAVQIQEAVDQLRELERGLQASIKSLEHMQPSLGGDVVTDEELQAEDIKNVEGEHEQEMSVYYDAEDEVYREGDPENPSEGDRILSEDEASLLVVGDE